MDSGITHSNIGFPLIKAMAVYNGELYMAGEFDSVNFIPAKYIAKWNGTTWSSAGTGTNGQINALVVYKGELYATGLLFAFGTYNIKEGLAKWSNGNCFPVTGNNGKSIGKSFVNFYPNPITDKSEWCIQNEASEGKNLRVEMYDVFGREVINSEIINGKFNINPNNLLSGIYFYKIKNELKLISNRKLIINK